MSRVFFQQELEAGATFWRVRRRDGIMLGLTSHDRDLWFDGVLHRAAPGMVPSAIRRTADLSPDSAEVEGALTHDSIPAADLAGGRFDGAAVEIGVVDWSNLDRAVLYRGEIGAVSEQAGSFSAELRSAKADLEADLVPRTSPTCRAQFCGISGRKAHDKKSDEGNADKCRYHQQQALYEIAGHCAAMLFAYFCCAAGTHQSMGLSPSGKTSTP